MTKAKDVLGIGKKFSRTFTKHKAVSKLILERLPELTRRDENRLRHVFSKLDDRLADLVLEAVR